MLPPMNKIIFTLALILFSYPLFSQIVTGTTYSNVTVTTYNNITGYIEIRDRDYFDRLDKITQDLYIEHMDYYNKAWDFYQKGEDFESAYFYFNKSFNFNWYSQVKVVPDDEIMQNKALYTLLSILKVENARKDDVVNARELVDDKCDPERKRIAYEAYNSRKKKH